MKLTNEQFTLIEKHLPVQRGNVRLNNQDLINALLFMAENGLKWRALPEKYGKWSTVHKRISRWAESGVLLKIFQILQGLFEIEVKVIAMDGTCCKVHPDGTGALKKTGSKLLVKPKADGTQKYLLLPLATAAS